MQNGRNHRVQSASVTALALAVAMLASGCQQARNDPSTSGAIDTGTYPNLNVKPGVANEQLTAEEMAAAKAQLEGSAAANASRNPTAPNDQALLKRLAAQHAREALRKIEQGQ